MLAVHARAEAGGSSGWLGRSAWPIVSVASVAVALLVSVRFIEGSAAGPQETAELVRWLSIALTGTFAISWRSSRRMA
jgi:hypothetical protein